MGTENYNFPEIDPAARFDGANDINKLASAIDSQMKQVEILGKDSQFTLQPATRTKLGGVRIGANVNVSADGTISTDIDPYVLPPASSTTLGGVSVPANSGINLTPDGTISIDDKSVTLPVNSVTTAQLQDKCVTGTKIADDAVTYEKLSTNLQTQLEKASEYARGIFKNVTPSGTFNGVTTETVAASLWGPLLSIVFNRTPFEVSASGTDFDLLSFKISDLNLKTLASYTFKLRGDVMPVEVLLGGDVAFIGYCVVGFDDNQTLVVKIKLPSTVSAANYNLVGNVTLSLIQE